MQRDDTGDDEKRMAGLHQGPRMLSQATTDFEIVLRAFIAEESPPFKQNRLGEVEVEIGRQTYNLSKILEHKPDFEHINFSAFTKDQNAEAEKLFRLLTTWRVELDDSLNVDDRENLVIYEAALCQPKDKYPEKGKLLIAVTPDGLICKLNSPKKKYGIPWSSLPTDIPKDGADIQDLLPYLPHIATIISHVDTSEICETEARAIRYYSMGSNSNDAFLKINRFVRENGKISDLNNPDTVDLRTMMFVYAFYTKAITSLRSIHKEAEIASGKNDSSEQEVFRGENYDTPATMQEVMDKRTRQTLTLESGFVSASQSKEKSKLFTHQETNKQNLNIQITVKQKVNSYGVDTARFSELSGEREVGFLPFTHFVFSPSPADKNAFTAVPVRAIDEIYYHHYHHKLIDIRTKLLKLIDDYSKQPQANAALIKTIENFCLQAFNHGAAEMSQTWNACNDCLRSLATMANTPAISSSASSCIALIKEMKQELEELVQHDLTILNGSLLAAGDYVYAAHLKNAYTQPHISQQDLQHIFKPGGVTIERPNHGLAHVMRKAMYVPVIYNVLMMHAKDETFRKTLACITPDQLKLLQIAILFSVSGRESELGAIDNKDQYAVYLSYRNAAKANFQAYVEAANLMHKKEKGKVLTDEQDEINAFIKTLTQQVERFGDPAFLNEVIADKRPERACLYNILNMAHNLDLMRCYTADKIGDTLTKMSAALTSLYLDESFPAQGMPVLLKMASDCIAVTGDRQLVAFQRGELVAAASTYSEAFMDCSRSAATALRTCFLATPVFAEMANDKINDYLPHSLTPVQKKLLSFDRAQMADIADDPSLNKLQKMVMELTRDFRVVIISPKRWDELQDCVANDETLDRTDLAIVLHLALRRKQPAIAALAIDKGADLTLQAMGGITPLHYAVFNNMPDIVRILVAKPDSAINQPADNNVTPVITAINKNQGDVIRELIKSDQLDLSGEAGSHLIVEAITSSRIDIVIQTLDLHPFIDLNYQWKFTSPLICAVEKDLPDLASKLLQHGARINHDSAEKDNALRTAIQWDHWSLVNLFASHPTVDVNFPQNEGNTLLRKAILLRDQTLFDTLMNRQARVDIRDANNITDVEMALNQRSPFAKQMITVMITSEPPPDAAVVIRVMRKLLEASYDGLLAHAFDLIYVQGKRPVNECDAEGKTLLHHVCETASITYMQKLLDMKSYADFLGTCPFTPLYFTVVKNVPTMAEILIEHGATISAVPLHDVDAVKQSPILLAANNRRWIMLEELVKATGASLNVYDANGNSPLFLACLDGKTEVVKAFIQQGADVTGKMIEAMSLNKSREILNVLLNAKDLNPEAKIGEFAVHKVFFDVVYDRNYELALQLMRRPDIAVNFVDLNGYTALRCAIEDGNREIISGILNLKSMAAEINSNAKDGKTPAIAAAEYSDWETLTKIITHPDFKPDDFDMTQKLLVVLNDEHGKEDFISKILKLVPQEHQQKHAELLYGKQQPVLQTGHTTMFSHSSLESGQSGKQTDLYGHKHHERKK